MTQPHFPESEVGAETTQHVHGAVRGDERSLAWLVDRFSPLLRAQAEYRLGRAMADRVSPDDVVQEAWISVLPKLASLVPKEGRLTPVLLAYLGKTVCGRAVNLLRSHLIRSSRERPLEPTSDSSIAPIDPVADLVRSSSGRAARSELAQCLTLALNSLSPQDREVLVIRLIEGRTNSEAAQELGSSPNTVAQRYHRALQYLRSLLPASLMDELTMDAT